MSVVIDCQSHVFPREYAELLTRNRNSLRTTGGDGVYLIDYAGVQRFRLNLDDYSPERKLADMDASAVDMSVISVNIPTPDLLVPDLAAAGRTNLQRCHRRALRPSSESLRRHRLAPAE